MNKAEIVQATKIAQSDEELPTEVDSSLYGCGLEDFKPIYTTIKTVARLLRWQCRQLNGGWDGEEYNNMCHIAKRKFLIMG